MQEHYRRNAMAAGAEAAPREVAADSAAKAVQSMEAMSKTMRAGVRLQGEHLQRRLQPSAGSTTLYRCAAASSFER